MTAEDNILPPPLFHGLPRPAAPRGLPFPKVATLDPAPCGVAPGQPGRFPDLTRDDVFRLETARLWLRWPRLGDTAAVEAYASRAEVAEMTGSWPHPLPPGETERRLFEARKRNSMGSDLLLVLTPRARPGHAIGSIGVSSAPGAGGGLELGYMLHPAHWGSGLMAEAVEAVVDTVFSYVDTDSLGAWTREDNPASQAVLTQAGFEATARVPRHLPARGGILPCVHFRLDRARWQQARPA